VYKVTVQAAPVNTSDWTVLATGTWTPGQPPQFADQILPPEVLEELFKITPSLTDKSGRNQVQFGDKLYGVVFRRLKRHQIVIS